MPEPVTRVSAVESSKFSVVREEGLNLALAKRSREFARDLQCDIAMPAPPSLQQMPVHTVCDKLNDR